MTAASTPKVSIEPIMNRTAPSARWAVVVGRVSMRLLKHVRHPQHMSRHYSFLCVVST